MMLCCTSTSVSYSSSFDDEESDSCSKKLPGERKSCARSFRRSNNGVRGRRYDTAFRISATSMTKPDYSSPDFELAYAPIEKQLLPVVRGKSSQMRGHRAGRISSFSVQSWFKSVGHERRLCLDRCR